MSEESLARRARSIEILKLQGVPFTEHLPAIEDESDSVRRSTEDVARRAIALCLVATKGATVEESHWRGPVELFSEAGDFTPSELAFIQNSTPSRRDLIQFSWRYECYWVMLWALGFIHKLERPDRQCKVNDAYAFLKSRGREGFFKDTNLRPQAEILDEADLIYRYHWAVVDARVNRREIPPWLAAGVGVTIERHYALNWLVGYMDQAWDDVTTDT